MRQGEASTSFPFLKRNLIPSFWIFRSLLFSCHSIMSENESRWNWYRMEVGPLRIRKESKFYYSPNDMIICCTPSFTAMIF